VQFENSLGYPVGNEIDTAQIKIVLCLVCSNYQSFSSLHRRDNKKSSLCSAELVTSRYSLQGDEP
jgi:hypothetical protein